jgi:hypothetical protein
MGMTDRIALFTTLIKYFPAEVVIDSIFRRTPPDEIYFGYVAYNINMMIGEQNV